MIVVGAGLSGLVAATELTAAGRRVILLDQEPAASLGGQAFWSFGGLFLVDSPSSAAWASRTPRARPRRLARLGAVRPGAADGEGPDRWGTPGPAASSTSPRVTCVRGSTTRACAGSRSSSGPSGRLPAGGHGNSVPRFHVTWGPAPASSNRSSVRPSTRRPRASRHPLPPPGHLARRHRRGRDRRAGRVLAEDPVERGEPSVRTVVGEVELSASAVVVSSGDRREPRPGPRQLARRGGDAARPDALGRPRLDRRAAPRGGARRGCGPGPRGPHVALPEGIANHSPVWTNHGIRILPGPTSLWMDADGNRLPSPLFPGFDALGSLQHVTDRGDDHSWFVLNKAIMESEFALSGSEQNPDLTGKSVRLLAQRVLPGPSGPSPGSRPSPRSSCGCEPDRARRRHERPDRRDARLARPHRRGRPRTTGPAARRPGAHGSRQGPSGRGDRDGPQVLRGPRHPRLTAAPAHHAQGRPDARGAALGPDPQDARRPAHRHRRSRAAPRRLGVRGPVRGGRGRGLRGGGVHGHRALEGTFLGGCLFSGGRWGALARNL
ncbi:FAD-binding protein [Oerskovia sp. M15]